jgi:hypothetical protein
MSEKRKAVIKTRKIELDGEWEGWWFICRTNPPMSSIADLLSGNIDRMIESCKGIIKEWNFVDEEGNPLPPPQDGGVELVPSDLFQALSNAAGSAPFQAPPNS